MSSLLYQAPYKAHQIGQAHGLLYKAAGDAVAAPILSGRLFLSSSGWLLLSVPNGLVRGLFDTLDEEGLELPPGKNGAPYNAHISVMRKEEVESIGGGDRITERGKVFHYQLGPLKEVAPMGWDEMSKVWFVEVKSSELQNLRKSYGLPGLPQKNDTEMQFHISVAVRRKKVLQNNEVSKAASVFGGFTLEKPKGAYKQFRDPSNPLLKNYPLEGVTYPTDYGYLPGYVGEDEDDLDVFQGSGSSHGLMRVNRPDVPGGAETKVLYNLTPEERLAVLQAFKPVLSGDPEELDTDALLQRMTAFKSKVPQNNDGAKQAFDMSSITQPIANAGRGIVDKWNGLSPQHKADTITLLGSMGVGAGVNAATGALAAEPGYRAEAAKRDAFSGALGGVAGFAALKGTQHLFNESSSNPVHAALAGLGGLGVSKLLYGMRYPAERAVFGRPSWEVLPEDLKALKEDIKDDNEKKAGDSHYLNALGTTPIALDTQKPFMANVLGHLQQVKARGDTSINEAYATNRLRSVLNRQPGSLQAEFIDVLHGKHVVSNPLDRAIQGLPPAQKAANELSQLHQAKAYSDRKQYAGKHDILQRQMKARMHKWRVDSEEKGMLGITHSSGYRFHVPAYVVPTHLRSQFRK